MAAGDAADTIERAVSRNPLLSELSRVARDRGWTVYVVGGWIRDRLIGRRSHDVDLILGPDSRSSLTWLEERSSHRAVTFERRIVNHRLTIDGGLVDVVEQEGRTLACELGRRDFRVNAIAWALAAARLEDPCDGLGDLARGLLDPPAADAFQRDPLRMLRGVRLSCEIDRLRLSPRARELAAEGAGAIRTAAAERVLEELDRTLLTSRAAEGVRAADSLGLVEPWIPEIAPCRDLTQNRNHHLDVWEHTLLALELSSHPGRLGRGLVRPGWPAAPRDAEDPPRPEPRLALEVLRWSLLLHDLAKPDTLGTGSRGQRTFHGHELVGARRAEEIGRRLKMPRDRIRALALVIRQHLRLVVPPEGEMSRRALARIVRALGPWTEVLALHSLADQGATRGPGWRRVRTTLRATIARLLALDRAIAERERRGRLVDGTDVIRVLGLDPGPDVGRVLRRIEELRDEGRLESRDDALAWLASTARSKAPDSDG